MCDVTIAHLPQYCGVFKKINQTCISLITGHMETFPLCNFYILHNLRKHV